VSEVPVAESGMGERPYGSDPIALLAVYATYNLLFIIFYYDPSIVAVWLIVVVMEYTFVYGLWKPKRWARKLGITVLGLGMIVSVVMLLAPKVLSTIERWGFYDFPVWWNIPAFYLGWRFLNRPKVRDYIESEGHLTVAPFQLIGRKIPDMVRGKRPESVAWITEARSVGQIFLDENSLIIVKSPSGEVIDIPMKDIVGLERGETWLRRGPIDEAFSIAIDRASDVGRALHAMDLSPFGETKLSRLRISYLTKFGQTSTVTLVAERKVCPRCGKKMSLVAAGWHCMKDDYLIDPTTNNLVQMIDSKRFAEDT